MARFRTKVRLAVFPKGLVDDVVRHLLDAAEELPIGRDGLRAGDETLEEVRLVEGRHLEDGARYRVDNPGPDAGSAEVTVASWDRADRIRLDGAGESDGHTVTFSAELDMAGSELRAVRVDGAYEAPKGRLRSLRRATWEAAATFGDGRGPEVSLRVRHRLARASLRLDCGAGKGGRWEARVAADARGGGFARPLVSPALAVARLVLRRRLAEAAERFEAGWNATVPDAVERGVGEWPPLRHEVTVRPVSREWAEQYAAGVREEVEALRFERGRLVQEGGTAKDVRLVEGRHLEDGARYRLADLWPEPVDATVEAWGEETRVGFRTDDGARSGRFELRGVEPGAAFVRWSSGGSTWEGHADLAGWWAAEKPLTYSIRDLFGGLDVSVARSPGTDEWKLTAAATVEARDWTRPLMAVAGLFPVQNLFRGTVDDLAEKWDEAVESAPDDPRTPAPPPAPRFPGGAPPLAARATGPLAASRRHVTGGARRGPTGARCRC